MFNILFEDKNLIVLIKPVGISSEEGMISLLREYFGDLNAYIGVIHRLDTAVSGVMVYAKTKTAAADLSRQIQDGVFIKKYLAVVRENLKIIAADMTTCFLRILLKISRLL